MFNTKSKVLKVQGKVNSAFKVFEKAHGKVVDAVNHLNLIVKESEEKIKEIEKELATEVEHKEHALKTIVEHNEMLEKLSNFLPKKP